MTGDSKAMDNIYETERLLHEYLLFHYGRPDEVLPYSFGPREALDYPLRCVTELLDPAALPEGARGLDLGCAVGRSTFELARHCARVTGIDFSASFIVAAQRLQREGTHPYTIAETGTILGDAEAQVDPEIDRARAHFEVGDAHCVRDDLEAFDVVLAANLLCRMGDPRKLLARLPALVKPGGQLLLTTPNTWLEEYTPRENWLGATPETGHPIDVLRTELDGAFSLESVRDMPFLIREHARKFQWSVAQGSVWKRR